MMSFIDIENRYRMHHCKCCAQVNQFDNISKLWKPDLTRRGEDCRWTVHFLAIMITVFPKHVLMVLISSQLWYTLYLLSRRRWTVRLNHFLVVKVSSQVWHTGVLTVKTTPDCPSKPLPGSEGQ